MQNTPGAAEPPPGGGAAGPGGPLGPGEPGPGGPAAPPGPPQATRRTTVALAVALMLVVVMSGVLATVAVLMTRNPDAPPLSTTTLRRLATPIHFAPVELVGPGPCAGAEMVPDDAGATCYQLEPGVTVAVVQKIESLAESDGKYAVRVVLAPDSRAQIADLTRDTVNRQLAIVVADKVVAAPRVAQEITEDSLSIAGFTQQEAVALLARLSGPASAPPAQSPAVVTPPPVTDPGLTDPAVTQSGTPQNTGQPLAPQAGDNPSPAASGNNETKYASCREAIAAGAGPFFKGTHPQYAWYVDKDNDGVACDRDDV
ncbi:excalibur calcium-binding domain-containing protein [Acrocarpospora sp. B8E8]